MRFSQLLAVRVPADVAGDAALQDAARDHLGQRPLQGEPLPGRGPDPAREGRPRGEGGEHAVVQAGKLLGKILTTAGQDASSLNRTKNHPHFILQTMYFTSHRIYSQVLYSRAACVHFQGIFTLTENVYHGPENDLRIFCAFNSMLLSYQSISLLIITQLNVI